LPKIQIAYVTVESTRRQNALTVKSTDTEAATCYERNLIVWKRVIQEGPSVEPCRSFGMKFIRRGILIVVTNFKIIDKPIRSCAVIIKISQQTRMIMMMMMMMMMMMCYDLMCT